MALRDIAIVGTAQRPSEVNSTFTSVEILLPVIQQLLDKVGIERSDIGFWCHGSCDYMSGQPFSFVSDSQFANRSVHGCTTEARV